MRWRGMLDPALALALTVASQLEIWQSDLHHAAAASVSTALVTAAISVRRRWPVVVAALALTMLVLHQAVIGDVEHASAFTVLAMAVAMYSLGAYGRPRRALVLGGAGVIAFVAIAVSRSKPVGDVAFAGAVMFGPWLAGLELHRRATREQYLQRHAQDLGELAEHRARAAVEEERSRIARELHDVVAHAMSVIVVQAGAERHVLPPEQQSTRAVLETIERTGRQALVEMRRLVGMMRSNDDELLALAPQPSMACLPDLCDQVQAAGLPVELEVMGDAVSLPPGVDVSAYRIVQEALTNALKHAGPTRAHVRVSYGTSDLEIEITDDGRGVDITPGPGHGLLGMRERVAVYGGALQAGNRPSGGYGVHVTLPLSGPLL